MTETTPLHVVVAGGGGAALETVMALRDLAADRVRITLIAPEGHFELKPLRTAEPFSLDHVRRHPLAELAARFDCELRKDAVTAVDVARHAVTLAGGAAVAYDALVLAVGARRRPAYERAITFGADDRIEALNGLLADLEQHYSRSVAFVVPPGVSWPLPLYELALMTAREVRGMGIDDARLTIVSPESAPLAIFGPRASDAVAQLLDRAGVGFRGGAYAEVNGGPGLRLLPGGDELSVDRIVSLPVLDGPAVPGLPADDAGFIPIDEHGRVRGAADVYAAGDGADFPVKQGGLACQQADAIAEHLAARAGAAVEPQPFHPVLRGKLLTGRGAEFLRADLHGGDGESRASDLRLWSPPAKISGRYLSQWLADLDRPAAPDEAAGVSVEVALPSAYTV